jgi:hypothetical protein
LSAGQRDTIVQYLQKSIKLPEVRSLQIDFDAVGSEREFYRDLIAETRRSIDAKFPLTITALASWCSGDIWLGGLPIDDAVPMLFDIGDERKEVAGQLESGSDWNEPLCRNSYGISINEPPLSRLKQGRRIYLFKSSAWNKNDLDMINKAHEN